jgi:hypothetical protein
VHQNGDEEKIRRIFEPLQAQKRILSGIHYSKNSDEFFSLSGFFKNLSKSENEDTPAARDANPALEGSLVRCQYFYRILYRSSPVTAVNVKSRKDRILA